MAHPCRFCTSAPSRCSCGMNGGAFLFPFFNFYFPISIFYLQGWAEVSGGEVFERLETANQLDAGYTALPVEGAQKGGGEALALAGAAFPTARDPVAARVGTE